MSDDIRLTDSDLFDEEPSSVLTAALQYAANGWLLFPVPRGEKKSHKSAAHSNGYKWGMTRDHDEIKRDWSRWPDANVGIPTGYFNGVFVVEADTVAGHGVDGLASLKQLEDQFGPLPDTRMAESPSGSVHRFYRHPGTHIRIVNSASTLAPGVDVRGDGGMVVAPPSVKPGVGTYRWLNDLALAEAPDWLIELVQRREVEVTDTSSEPTAEAARLAAALDVIPNDSPNRNWELWNRVCMSVFRATGGSDEGRDMADRWSQQSPHYDAAYTAAKWDGYRGCPPTELGAGTIFYMADQIDMGWRRRYEEEVARRVEQVRINGEIGEGSDQPSLPTIMTVAEMIDRLVWIGMSGAIIDRVTFRIRKKEHAATEYAASFFRADDAKKNTPCLNAWLTSAKRMSVDVMSWVPGAKPFCPPPEAFDGAQTSFNTWRGIKPMPEVEDWFERSKPFRDHIDFLVPVESERRRFLQWLAHIVQRPEELPHTAYLMVTPTTGIGRNWLASVLARVLAGHVAVGIEPSELLDSPFNGRLSRKLLVILDEIREGSGGQRYQRAIKLTGMITAENRRINPKFGFQSIEKNCARWLMFSNYYDAVPFDNKDRRIEFIANPTVRKEPVYYSHLYGLLNDPMFIASVRQLFMTFNLAGFNPGAHAALNAAKQQAIVEMKSDVEHAISEFAEDCQTGLVSRSEIESFINKYGQPPVNAMHLTHAITAAGMVNTGRRVKSFGGVRHRVVIVDKNKWTIEKVEKASQQALLEAMGIRNVKDGAADKVMKFARLKTLRGNDDPPF